MIVQLEVDRGTQGSTISPQSQAGMGRRSRLLLTGVPHDLP